MTLRRLGKLGDNARGPNQRHLGKHVQAFPVTSISFACVVVQQSDFAHQFVTERKVQTVSETINIRLHTTNVLLYIPAIQESSCHG